MSQQLFPSSTFSYDEARTLLIALFEQCQRKLSQADWRLAYERLGALEEDDVMEWVADTALFSYRGRRRAIDRILPKLKVSDGLAARLKEGLSRARFSVFEVVRIDSDSHLLLKDLLNGCQELTLVDHTLARAGGPGLVFAARLIDMGPWHMGLGIIEAVNKSAAVAMGLLLEQDGRERLHELVYHCELHGVDLTAAVAIPTLEVLCESFDESSHSAAEVLQRLRGTAGKLEAWLRFGREG